MEILCFFAGIAFINFKNFYPLLLPVVLFIFRPKLSIIIWFFLAIAFSYAHQWRHQDFGMPDQPVVKNAVIKGYIDSIPVKSPNKSQFHFVIEYINDKPAKARVLLNCYNHCPDFQAGQYWQLTTKLKRPRNLSNPGGFNYVRFLAARHIDWTGTIQPASARLISYSVNSLLSIRASLADKLLKNIPDEQIAGIIQALTLGVTNHIDQKEWDLFRRTGTIHLMVISGAHVGLVTGIIYFLVRWGWCWWPGLCLFYPAQRAASVAGLCAAFIYTLLAGFGVPAQRALIVCFFMLLRNLCSYHFSTWQAWRYSLLGVLIFEPHSVLMPGFYLSFIAVAVLLVINQRFNWKGLTKTIVMQAGCLAGLTPLTLYLFSYGAVNGLVANLIAVPWVGFVIIPLSLLMLCLQQWLNVHWLVYLLNLSITGLLKFLIWIDSFSILNIQSSFTDLVYPLALLTAIAIVLLLPLFHLLPAAFLLACSVFFPAHEQVKENEAKISILDVGQGLAVVVRTAKHVLIYDAGVQFYQGSDMAKLAIIPYLDTLGVKKIDKIVISHPDMDHRGGLNSLEENYPVEELIVDNPDFYHRGFSCYQYPSWMWEGVSFRFFSLPRHLKGKNNQSCVLQIQTQGGAVLLTGDIEKPAEQFLVATYGDALHSSVLLIPHHASKTSSSSAFIQQVKPDFAIASYGFDNRYHFPHSEAVKNYQKENIPIYNTADCGMVALTLNQTAIAAPRCKHLLK